MKPAAQSILLFFILATTFPQQTLADIRHYKINTKHNANPSLLLIDYFQFIKDLGQLQLNVTDIHFSNPNPNLNLSQIGFFLARVDPQNLVLVRIPCVLHLSNVIDKIVYTFDNLHQGGGGINNSFNHTFFDIKTSDLYTLYFQNCGNHDVTISMDVRYAMYNILDGGDGEGCHKSYLWPSQIYSMKMVYPTFSLIHFSLAFLWLYKLYNNYKNNRPPGILLLFSLILVFKAWSLIFQVLHDIYLLHNGCSQCWTSILLNFTSEFFSGAPLVTFILLLVTGWSLVKPKLLHNDHILVMAVIFMHLFLNALKILTDQMPPTQDILWYEATPPIIFLLLNMLYAIPVTKALRSFEAHLRSNENPSVILKYSSIFGSIALQYFGYTLLKLCSDAALVVATSRYTFSGTMLRESIELLYYVYIGYKLRHEKNKEKLLLYNEDIEKAAAEVLGLDRDNESFIIIEPGRVGIFTGKYETRWVSVN